MNQNIGPYEILEELSSGGFGRVYKGKHQQSQAIHAVKVLHKTSDIDKKRFIQEVSSLAKLEHANIVRIYDYNIENNQPWMSMEFVNGGTLGDYYKNNSITPRQSAKMMYILLGILEYVHVNGFIHRDIKPENIMITEDGRMKLADFGIAKNSNYSSDELTKSHELLGTLYYMSPEQTKRSKDVDERSDIYSVGAVLYFMMTGNSPHAGVNQFDSLRKILSGNIQSPREANKTVPRSLESICYKALALEVEERYQSCGDFREDIRRFLVNEKVSVASRRVHDLQRVFRKYKKRIIGAGVVGIGVFTAIYGIVQGDLNTLERINGDLKIQQAETVVLLNQLEEQSIKINADRELIKIHDNTDDNKFILNVNEENVLELYEKCSNKSLGAYIVGKYCEGNVKKGRYFVSKAIHSYLSSFQNDNNNFIAKNKLLSFMGYGKYATYLRFDYDTDIIHKYTSDLLLSSDLFVILNRCPELFVTNEYMLSKCQRLLELLGENGRNHIGERELRGLDLDREKLDKGYPSTVLRGLYDYKVEKKYGKALKSFKSALDIYPESVSLYPLIAETIVKDIDMKKIVMTNDLIRILEIFRYNEALDYLEDYIDYSIVNKNYIPDSVILVYKETYKKKIRYFASMNYKEKAQKLSENFIDTIVDNSYFRNSEDYINLNNIIELLYYAEHYTEIVKLYGKNKNTMANQYIFRKIKHPRSSRSAYRVIDKIYKAYQVAKQSRDPCYSKSDEEEFLRRVVAYGAEVEKSLTYIEKNGEKRHGVMARILNKFLIEARSKYTRLYNEISKK